MKYEMNNDMKELIQWILNQSISLSLLPRGYVETTLGELTQNHGSNIENLYKFILDDDDVTNFDRAMKIVDQ